MSEAGKIYELIPKVMEEIGAIGKDKRNQQQNYNFRGIDDVYNAAQPAMVKHGIFPTTTVSNLHREDRTSKGGGGLIYTTLLMTVRFTAIDGSFVETTTVGEAMDSGDKSANKAMSAALKYAFFQTFVIPTQEMVDSEKDTHEIEPKQQQHREKPRQQAQSDESKAFNEWVTPLIGKNGLTKEFVRELVNRHGYAVARSEIEKTLASEGAK